MDAAVENVYIIYPRYYFALHSTSVASLNMSQIPEPFKKGYKVPFQTQDTVPGQHYKLNPIPINDITADGTPYKAAGKLEGRIAIVTGADSGIGRAIATLFGAFIEVRLSPCR